MPEHQYRVFFMVAPPRSLMWSDTIDIELNEAIAHSNDHDRVIEAVRVKRGVDHDSQIYVMSCTPAVEKQHPWERC